MAYGSPPGGIGSGVYRRYHQMKEAQRRASKRNKWLRALIRKYGGTWGRKIARRAWPAWLLQGAYYTWKNRRLISWTWKNKSNWRKVRDRYMNRYFTPRTRRRTEWAPDWQQPYYPRRRRNYGSRRYSRWGRRPYRRYAQDWR